MTDLQNELKQLIIETLELEDISVEDINSAEALFGEAEGLGLDSIDALELGLALQKRYGVKVDADSAETKKHFASVDNLAALVSQYQTNS
ncbi:MAG: phosphopantetheine-binding protein [Rickettsiales bacterium]